MTEQVPSPRSESWSWSDLTDRPRTASIVAAFGNKIGTFNPGGMTRAAFLETYCTGFDVDPEEAHGILTRLGTPAMRTEILKQLQQLPPDELTQAVDEISNLAGGNYVPAVPPLVDSALYAFANDNAGEQLDSMMNLCQAATANLADPDSTP